MRCDAEPKNLPPAMPHDQQAVEQTKRDRQDDEQIHCRDAVGVIIKKCFPTLGRRTSTLGLILGHAGLPYIDAELEKLAVDPRRSPRTIGNAHLADRPAYFNWNSRPTTTPSRLPTSVRSKLGAVPSDNGVRLDDRKRIANFREQPIEINEYQSVDGAERVVL